MRIGVRSWMCPLRSLGEFPVVVLVGIATVLALPGSGAFAQVVTIVSDQEILRGTTSGAGGAEAIRRDKVLVVL